MNEQETSAAARLRGARRLVVKVGSAILCGEQGVRTDWLTSLAADIAERRAAGVECVIVSSGAVAIGRRALGLMGALSLEEKQAASAAGQAQLVEYWRRAFDPPAPAVAQVLLTIHDTEDRRRYLNARATFQTLIELRALPVVNENDTVATSELRYGDNDRLAAHTAQLADADTLVILSDIDGVYDRDPRLFPEARRFEVIEAITPEIENGASGPNVEAQAGSGGMATKIAAARIAGNRGCATIIAAGSGDRPLSTIMDGGPATLICASQTPTRARQAWIAGRLAPAGAIHVDEGAAKALRMGASLLPAGVIRIEGDFRRGDSVAIFGPDGFQIGQGLCAYSSDEAALVAGRKSGDIEMVLGYRRRPAIVEKDDLALTGG